MVQRDGLYTLQARTGSALPGRTFHIEVGGIDVSGERQVPRMPDWDQYATVSVPDIYLRAGRQTVRVVMGPEDFMELQWIAAVRQTSNDGPGRFGGAAHVLPARIEAEDYDTGGQDVGYHDSTPGSEAGFAVYRNDDVDIKVSSAGGHAVGWIRAGEWLDYTVSANTLREFAIKVRLGSALPNRSFHIEVDGQDVSGPMAVPTVVDWDRYKTVAVPGVWFVPGEHIVRLVMGSEDWMDFQWLSIE
jgi:hypothetical protein